MSVKKLLSGILMIAPVLTFAQQNYTLLIKAGQLNNPGKAYLNYRDDGKNITDSAALSGRQYIFKGTTAEPELAQLSIRKEGAAYKDQALLSTSVWLEQGMVKVTSKDPLTKPLITGGQMNTDYQALQTSKTTGFAKMEAASKMYAEASEEQKKAPDFMKNHNKIYNEAMSENAIKDSLYINSHPNSYLSLYLTLNTISTAPAPVLERHYKALSKPLQTSYRGKELLNTINTLKSKEIGGKAPEFTLNDASGKPISLSSFRGKYVLLDFWASWCVPCRKENPNVKAAYERFKNKNFRVISVSIDMPDAKEKWLAAIEKDQLNWTQLCDVNGGSNQLSLLYDVKSIPQNFLIDPNGKILAKGLRGPELQKKLAEFIR